MPSVSRDATLSHHVSIINSISVDFQESQCFFVISIQAALFVALSGDSSVLGATNLTQLRTNFAEATGMSSKFIVRVAFGLWILHRSHLDSTYILFWSVASIVISTVALFSKTWEQPNITGINQISDLDRLDKCGHNPPPIVYCATGPISMSPFFLHFGPVDVFYLGSAGSPKNYFLPLFLSSLLPCPTYY
jgi:hypothetical protein